MNASPPPGHDLPLLLPRRCDLVDPIPISQIQTPDQIAAQLVARIGILLRGYGHPELTPQPEFLKFLVNVVKSKKNITQSKLLVLMSRIGALAILKQNGKCEEFVVTHAGDLYRERLAAQDNTAPLVHMINLEPGVLEGEALHG